jgi:hypothetical protein
MQAMPVSSDDPLAAHPYLCREGKRSAPALFGAGELYIEPIDTYVAPPGAPPTIYRDQRVFKHMGTLTRAGHW